ncbi:MAG: type I 3-dehydroquinate dehydratase [Bilifractor sp.]|jgi:3-dehydroquinate dehydratase-1
MWNLWAFLTGRRQPADRKAGEHSTLEAAGSGGKTGAAKSEAGTDWKNDALKSKAGTGTETDTGSPEMEGGKGKDTGKPEAEDTGADEPEAEDVGTDETEADDEWVQAKPEKHRSLYDRSCGHGKKRKTPKIEKIPVVLNDRVTLGDGDTKICVPLSGSTDDELEDQARSALQAGADVVEWRADYYEAVCNVDASAAALKKIHEILGDIPVLFTYRTSREGGKGCTDGDTYSAVALWAAEQPEIALIDIEGLSGEYDAEILVKKVKELGKPVIASAHFFDRTPKKNELVDIFGCLQRTGADILKVAVMPEKSRDVLRMMDVSREMDSSTSCPLITIAMGDLGKITRVSGNLTGSCMTFGTAGAATAPGQMTVEKLRRVMEEID